MMLTLNVLFFLNFPVPDLLEYSLAQNSHQHYSGTSQHNGLASHQFESVCQVQKQLKLNRLDSYYHPSWSYLFCSMLKYKACLGNFNFVCITKQSADSISQLKRNGPHNNMHTEKEGEILERRAFNSPSQSDKQTIICK